MVALARLILDIAIPDHYTNIVYLDGDLQIVGDVRPLVTYRVPDGMIAAGRGSLWLERNNHDVSNWFDGYLQGLGGVSSDTYFNSGVLAFRRDTWNEIAPKALQFFFENSQACPRHDQAHSMLSAKGV